MAEWQPRRISADEGAALGLIPQFEPRRISAAQAPDFGLPGPDDRTIWGQLAEVPRGMAVGAVGDIGGSALRGAEAVRYPWRDTYVDLLDRVERADVAGARVQDLLPRFEAQPSPLDAITGPGPRRRAEPASELASLDETIRTQLPREQAGILRRALRERIQRKGKGQPGGAPDPIAEARAAIPPEITERPLYQAGEAVSEAVETAFPASPGYHDSLGRTLGRGLGSVAAGVAVGLASGPAAPVTLGALFGAAGAGEAADRAIGEGAGDAAASTAARLGVLAGSTDIVPIEILLRRIPGPAQRAVEAVAKRVGGERVAAFAGRVGLQTVVEAVQEGGQQTLQNLIAREVYKPEQELTEGVVPSAALGGGVGAIAALGREGVVALASRRSNSRTGDRARAVMQVPPPSPADEASPIPTMDIQAGREVVADALAVETANRSLEAAGFQPIGQPVRLNDGTGRFVEGVVTDAETGQDGSVLGVTVSVQDQRFGPDPLEIDMSLTELAERGVTLQGMPMPPSAEELTTQDETAAQDRLKAQEEAAREAEKRNRDLERLEAKIEKRADDQLKRYEKLTGQSQPQPTGEPAEPPRAYGVDESGTVRSAVGPEGKAVLGALAGGSPTMDASQLGGALAGLSGTPDGDAMLRALAGAERTPQGDMVMRALAGQGQQMNAEHLGLALSGMAGSPDGAAMMAAMAGGSPTAAVAPGALAGGTPTADVSAGAMAGRGPEASIPAGAMAGGSPTPSIEPAALAGESPRPDGAQVQAALAGLSGTPQGDAMLSALAGTSPTPDTALVRRALAGRAPTPTGESLQAALAGMSATPQGDAMLAALAGTEPTPEGAMVQAALAGGSPAADITPAAMAGESPTAQGVDVGRALAGEQARALVPETKAVDDKGDPVRVFHGTGKDYETVPPRRRTMYYTTNPRIASEYAEVEGGADKAPNVRPAYMDFRNPAVIDAKGARFDQIPLAEVQRALPDVPVEEIQGATASTADSSTVEHGARLAGHDSVILRNVGDGLSDGERGDTYIAFRRDQVVPEHQVPPVKAKGETDADETEARQGGFIRNPPARDAEQAAVPEAQPIADAEGRFTAHGPVADVASENEIRGDRPPSLTPLPETRAPDETVVLSAANLQRRLLHGTSAEFDSEEIQPGHDGLIHLSEKEIAEFKRDYRHEYDSDIDTDDMPVLPDLRDWNPVNVGEAMVTAGLMSGEEVAQAKRDAGITDEAAVRQFDQETLRGELADALNVDLIDEEGHIRGLDELLQDAGDMAFDAEEVGGDFAYTTDEIDAIAARQESYEKLRNSLYEAAREKGIKAFKYRNAFERSSEAGSYSVGVIDPAILQPVERQEMFQRDTPAARPTPGAARIRLQRRFTKQQGRVAGDIQRIGKEVFGEGFHVELAQSIEAPDGAQAHGAYDPANRIAYIALRADEAGMTGSLYHEGLHHLRNAGAFTDAQGADTGPWKTLEREAVAKWRKQYGIEERYGPDTEGMDAAQRERLMTEEAIAEALADYQTRGKETGFGPTVRSALNRLMNFFKRMANGLRGRGFATAQDIFQQDIATGEAGRRADAGPDSDVAIEEMLLQRGGGTRPPIPWEKDSLQWKAEERLSDGSVMQATLSDLTPEKWNAKERRWERGAEKMKLDWRTRHGDSGWRVGKRPEGSTFSAQETFGVLGAMLRGLEAEGYRGDITFDAERKRERIYRRMMPMFGWRMVGVEKGKGEGRTDRFRIAPDADIEIPGAQLQREAQTPAFKRWFGESKVVDDRDRPLVVMHGGRFDETADAVPSTLPVFFTDETEHAERYANTGQVTHAYLKIEKPFHPDSAQALEQPWVDEWIDFWRENGEDQRVADDRAREGLDPDSDEWWDAEGEPDGWIDRTTGESLSNDDVKQHWIGMGRLPEWEGDGRNERWDDFLANVASHHDGYIGHDPTDQFNPDNNIYVVFDPKQIKSVNNRGTFELESPNILLQRAPSAKRDPKGFDAAASKWAGVDLRGAADAVIADKERMGGFAEDVRAQLQGTESVRAPGVEVVDKPTQADLAAWRRFFEPPSSWSKKFPSIHALVKSGIQAEIDQSNRIQRLNKDWDRASKKLSKDEFADLTGVMFLGDAEAVTFSDDDLAQMPITDKVRRAYRASRKLIDKIGRFVEQHRRSMSLPLLSQRTKLIRQMAGARNMDKSAFRKLYTERANLIAQQRSGTADPETIGARIDALSEKLHGTQPPSEQYAEWAAEADRIQPRIDETKIRRREGYVPHKFFGRWRIFEKVPESEAVVQRGFNDQPFRTEKAARDAAAAAGGGEVVEIEGGYGFKSQWKHVAGEHGFWPSRKDAVRAASKLSRQGAELRVAPVEFTFPEEQATQLSDAAYYRFMNNVEQMVGLEGQDLQDAVRGVARKRFRRRIAGFAQYRKGAQGFSKNLDRVIRTHIGETVRYVSLDKLKFDAINMMEREGLSENRTTVQSRPVLAAAVQQWFKDVNGQKQVIEGQIDQLLNKNWVTPLRGGLAAGAMAYVASGATANPISPIIGAYIGWRVGRGLNQGGPFPTRAITSGMLGDMSHLKLGMTLNVMSALVNTTQITLNTLPVLGTRATSVGFKRFNKAVLSKIRGKPNADWRLMERHDIHPLNTFAEGTRHQFQGEGKLSKISMAFFTSAEGLNRGVTFLGAVSKATDEGKSTGEAHQFAREAMRRTQFHYGAADKPELYRNVLLRVPAQFKNYVSQQIAFAFGLDPKKELPMFLMSLALLTGALGLPLLDLIDDIADQVADFSPIAAMKEEALKALARSELEGGIATFILRGAPGLAGVDMTGRAGMGDKFLPLTLRDWEGPWISTIKNAVRHGAEGASIEDHIRNITPGFGNPLKVLEAQRNGGVMTSVWKRGRGEYEMTPDEMALKALGARPVREARQQDLRDVERRKIEKRRQDVRRYVDRYVKARQDGDTAEMRRVLVEAREQGVPLSRTSIQSASRAMLQDRQTRSLKQLPRDMRREGARLRAAIDQAAAP